MTKGTKRLKIFFTSLGMASKSICGNFLGTSAQGRQVYTPPSRGLTRSFGRCWRCFRSLKAESQSHPPLCVEGDRESEYEHTILHPLTETDQPRVQSSEIKSRNTRAKP